MTIEHFSLMRGGPTFRLVRGLARLLPGANLPVVLSVLLVTATFVPLLVLCGREMPNTASEPDRAQIEEKILEDKVNKRAQRYLRDLRRDAVIEYS